MKIAKKKKKKKKIGVVLNMEMYVHRQTTKKPRFTAACMLFSTLIYKIEALKNISQLYSILGNSILLSRFDHFFILQAI
jgi:hypothetical protein